MKGSLKNLALSFSVLALMAVNAAASVCGGKTVYFKAPSDWTAPFYYYAGGGWGTVTAASRDGDWYVFSLTGGPTHAENSGFAIGKENAHGTSTQRWVGGVDYNISGQSPADNASTRISCTAFGAGDVIYISEDPEKPGKTVVNIAPPNARYFYFLPPKEENWAIGTPWYVYGSGSNLEKQKMLADERCGWFKLVYFSEPPPNKNGWIWLGSSLKSDEDQIGVLGVEEEMSDWVDYDGSLRPRPFNLFEQFGSGEGEKHLSFNATSGSWIANAPTEADIDPSRCFYNFAAIIYDTDKSVNASFTENEDDIGVGGNQYGFWTAGIIKNMVKQTLNDERKIECDQCDSKAGGFKSKEDFKKAFDPNDNSNVMVCYDMPFTRTETGLWEFDSDNMVNNQGRVVGGFFPYILQNRDSAQRAGADYSNCPDCDKKYPAESFVGLNLSKVNPWCFERGLQTRGTNVTCTGPVNSCCGEPYGEVSGGPNSDRGSYTGKALGHFAHGDWPADTWGHTPQAGSNEYNNNWNGEWREAQMNLWGGSDVGARAKVNPFFCFESHAEFTYEKGQEFFFRGDDDIWVYINKKLVIDLGGSHLAAPGYVELDKLGLTEGQKYPMDIFFCDRRTTMSNVRISTNMYFSQNTGLFVSETPENNDAPICLNKSGGGGCAAAVGGEGGSSQQCGSEITGNLHYFMQRRNGDRKGLDLDPVNNPSNCTESGDIITCYGGITINTKNGTVKVEKNKISGGGLSGTYFIYVEAKDPTMWQPTPPPRQVTRFSMASSVFAIWGDIQYETGGAVPGIPAQLRSVRNGEQSTLAGKLVPIAFADGAWMGENAFSVSDAGGLTVTISRSGLSNDDGTTELKIYKDEAGTQPVAVGETVEIPDSKVLVLWVTGNYEASEEFTYEVSAVGAQDLHKITVRLPKLEFVNSDNSIIARSAAFGSDPSLGATTVERRVYIGTSLDRRVAAFDPADGSLCTSCNFKITVNAWHTDENNGLVSAGRADSNDYVLRADAAEIENGIGEFSFRGMKETHGPGTTNPAFAALSVRGPSTLESTKAFWEYMIFEKPPVPIPLEVVIYDKDGDGKGDSLRIAYDRRFKKGTDSLPPNMIQVLWDHSIKDTIQFGLGTLKNGRYELDASENDNWDFWSGVKVEPKYDKFKISMEMDSIIVISGQWVDKDELERDNHAAFSEGVKTSQGSGAVVVRNWATYVDSRAGRTTTPFDAEIGDGIPAIVVSAIFNPGGCDRNNGPCEDQVIITLSEPVKKVDGVSDDRGGNLPSLAVPFQYKLVNKNGPEGAWSAYAGEGDLPIKFGDGSNIVWRPSITRVEPSTNGDSVASITYRYYPNANTPLRGDSVKLASGTNAALVDLEGNLPNLRERGRRFVGEIEVSKEKVPIGEVNPELCSGKDAEKCRDEIVGKIITQNENSGLTEKQKNKIRESLFKDGVTDYLPVLEGWDAKKVAEQYPGTVGIIIKPDVVSKGVRPENISFYASAFYHTNLGNYVVETAPLRELKCNDAIFDGDCTKGTGMGIYLAWNMRDAKNRWAGSGAYVEVYDFYWKVENSGDKNGTYDKTSKSIEMLGVKRKK